jgi:hypothetical protein
MNTIIIKKINKETQSYLLYKIYYKNYNNKQCVIKLYKNKIYILSYLCEQSELNTNCSQLDMYTLLQSIYQLCNKLGIQSNPIILYKNSLINYYYTNMLCLLKFKLYIYQKQYNNYKKYNKIVSRKISKLKYPLQNVIFKTTLNELQNNLKIFSNYYQQNKLYKYIYI